MSGAGIEKALEAAGDALRRPWPTFSTRGMTAEQQRARAHNLAAAAAIVAFHRHMAEHWRGFAPDWFAQHQQIAAAVEAAAQPAGIGAHLAANYGALADVAPDVAREIDGETE
jgi:hypothetical protein